MKKAFTMIELIFIIVILGILAAVAIPKLMATRDDAEVVKTVSNMKTLINDLATNMTSQGRSTTDLSGMTGVQLVDKGTGSGVLKVGKEKCFEVYLYDSGSNDIPAPSGGLTYSDGKDADFDYIMIKAINKTKKLCKMANELPEIKSTINNVPTKFAGKDITSASASGEAGFIIVGGSNLYGRKGDRETAY